MVVKQAASNVSTRSLEIVRAILDAKGWKQLDLAEASGITPSHLSRIFSGERELSLDHLVAIAEALGVKPGDLLENSAGSYAELLPIMKRLTAFTADERYHIGQALESIINVRQSCLSQASSILRTTPPSRGERGIVQQGSE